MKGLHQHLKNQFFLKEMKSKEKLEHKLRKTILHSQAAYEEYKAAKLYFQALRIYKANKKIYKLLDKYKFYADSETIIEVFNYLFHLDDWFLQFEALENKNPNLEDEFIFVRFEKSIPFPKTFVNKIS